MDIKLKARLSAYSKIDFPQGGATRPQAVSKEEIDTLFEKDPISRPVTKDEIDDLFDPSYDDTEEVTGRPVTYDEIDSLFK